MTEIHISGGHGGLVRTAGLLGQSRVSEYKSGQLISQAEKLVNNSK
jgi:hypothetical protein